MDKIDTKDRAVSPVISTILMAAIVVILAATVSVFALELGEDIQNPPPIIGQSTSDIDPNPSGNGGVITVTHIAGDSVEAKNIQVIVDATDACDARARVVNLPADYSYGQFNDDVHFQGDKDLLNQDSVPQFGGKDWDGGFLLEENDNTFSAGESFQLQISRGGCPLSEGDQIEIDIVHTPSNSIILSQELTV